MTTVTRTLVFKVSSFFEKTTFDKVPQGTWFTLSDSEKVAKKLQYCKVTSNAAVLVTPRNNAFKLEYFDQDEPVFLGIERIE